MRDAKQSLKPTDTMVRHLDDDDESSATHPMPETRWVKVADGKWAMAEISPQQQAAADIVVLQAPPHEMHGQCYGFEVARNGWAAPDCTFVSHATARPGYDTCLLYTSPSPRDLSTSRMPSSA